MENADENAINDITLKEIQKVIGPIEINKAAGSVNIPAEYFKLYEIEWGYTT